MTVGSIICWGTAVPLIQFPLSVRAGIWNLFMVLTIAHLFFGKDTVSSLTSTNQCCETGCQFNVNLRGSTHIDESSCL